tara:strand:- start:22 stop:1014 length:993 start_codon:yes stop_codon:yes gene_type:complete
MKTLFCTSTGDNFAPGCAVMIYSLRKHLKDFESNDLKVFYTSLSEENKQKIKTAAGPKINLMFVKPDDMEYCSGANTIYGKNNKDVYLCLESFNQPDYDTVICFDSDMLCINSFDYHIVDKMNADFAAVRTQQAGHDGPLVTDGHEKVATPPRFSNYQKVNGGFWIIGKRWLSGEVYNYLREIVIKRTHKIESADQATVNFFLKSYCLRNGGKFLLLPDGYNFKNWGGMSICHERKVGRGGENLFKLVEKDIKILHYSGRRKPWASIVNGWQSWKKPHELNPCDIPNSKNPCAISDLKKMKESTPGKLWHKYYEECFGEKCHSSVMLDDD